MQETQRDGNCAARGPKKPRPEKFLRKAGKNRARDKNAAKRKSYDARWVTYARKDGLARQPCTGEARGPESEEGQVTNSRKRAPRGPGGSDINAHRLDETHNSLTSSADSTHHSDCSDRGGQCVGPKAARVLLRGSWVERNQLHSKVLDCWWTRGRGGLIAKNRTGPVPAPVRGGRPRPRAPIGRNLRRALPSAEICAARCDRSVSERGPGLCGIKHGDCKWNNGMRWIQFWPRSQQNRSALRRRDFFLGNVRNGCGLKIASRGTSASMGQRFA